MTSDAKYLVYGVIVLVVMVGTILGCLMLGENYEYVPDEESVYVATPDPTHSDSYNRLIEPTPTPTQKPTPKPTQKIYIPAHAYGDKRECGTCHIYPSYDGNNIPQKPSFRPTPIPTLIPTQTVVKGKKTWQYTQNSPVPNDYYSCECMLPNDITMYEYMEATTWNVDNQYVRGSFDCSQMSAYSEWELENCGYHVVIRVADVEGTDEGHAWILVEFSDGWLAYETTELYWVYYDENPSMYYAGVEYESIYDVWNSYKHYSNGEEAFLDEFGWWIQ